MEDKSARLYRKLFVWQGRVNSGNLAAFLQCWISLTKMIGSSRLLELNPILRNTWRICQQLLSYYPFLTEDSDVGNEWIFSPFSMDAVSKAKITDDLQDNIIDMTTDRRFQTIFKEKSLSEYWYEVNKDYPSLGRSAMTALLPFLSTYLCERTFSAMPCFFFGKINGFFLFLNITFPLGYMRNVIIRLEILSQTL
jgi:hypothetical protein